MAVKKSKPMKKTALDKAIEHLDAERAVLNLAILKLEQQRAAVKAPKAQKRARGAAGSAPQDVQK